MPLLSSGFALVNIGHHRRRPVSDAPALRVLGGFDDEEAARQHAKIRCPQDSSILLVPLRKWFLLGTDETEASEFVEKKLSDVSACYEARRAAHKVEFDSNVENKQTGSVGSSTADLNKTGNVDKAGLSKLCDSVPREAELRNQSVAVLSFLDDYRKGESVAEPAALLWALADTEKCAKDYIRDVLSKEVSDVDLDVVDCYEWVFPTAVEKDDIDEEYREEELMKIMTVKKTEKKKVRDFQDWCGKVGQTVPEISITADGVETSIVGQCMVKDEDGEEETTEPVAHT